MNAWSTFKSKNRNVCAETFNIIIMLESNKKFQITIQTIKLALSREDREPEVTKNPIIVCFYLKQLLATVTLDITWLKKGKERVIRELGKSANAIYVQKEDYAIKAITELTMNHYKQMRREVRRHQGLEAKNKEKSEIERRKSSS